MEQGAGKSGINGINWVARIGKWRVQVRKGGAYHVVGYFKDLEVAKIILSQTKTYGA